MPKVEKSSDQLVQQVDRDSKLYNDRRKKALAQFDVMKMYFMEPYKINDKLTIYQPTVGDIIRFGDNGEFGEKEFYSSINIFVCNTTSYRLQLWDMGIDWNKISDFELFTMLLPGLHDAVQKVLFGEGVNLKSLKPFAVKENEEEKDEEKDEQQDDNQSVEDKDKKDQNDKNDKGNKKDMKPKFILYDPESQLEITEDDYLKMANYMRAMFNIYPKVEFAKGRTTKELLIDEERMKLNQKKEDVNSMLFPMISACLNHPGYKYKMDETRQLGIVAFMDSVQRLQVYENSTALLKGSFSGFVDSSKISRDEFNFMRDMY